MAFKDFITKHVGASIVIGIGALVASYGFLTDVIDLITLGFKPGNIQFTGFIIFAGGVVVLLYQQHLRIEGRINQAPIEPALPPDDRDDAWQDRLTPVTRRHFTACEVPLDDHSYSHCTFDNVTFVYGGGPFALIENRIGNHIIRPNSDATKRLVELLTVLGHIRSQGFDARGPVSQARHDAMRGTTRGDPA